MGLSGFFMHRMLEEVIGMGYRIEYGSKGEQAVQNTNRWGRIRLLTAGFLLVLILLTKLFWPEGSGLLRDVLLPGEADVTQTAFSRMVTQLQEGEPFGQVVAGFCEYVVEHGDIPTY